VFFLTSYKTLLEFFILFLNVLMF